MSTEISLNDPAPDNSLQDPPELSPSEPISPSDADNPYMTTDIRPSEIFLSG